jgi:hypothetical protein
MGCDWYSITNAEVYGVLIPNKQIKQAHKPGSPSSKTDDPLDSDTKNWLLAQMTHMTSDYRLFDLGNAFVFISKGNLVESEDLKVVGPYAISQTYHKFVININTDVQPRRDGERMYEDLVQIAQRMTLETEKMSFEPGLYRFTGTCKFPIEQIERGASTKGDETISSASHSSKLYYSLLQQNDLPTNFTIVVGQGEHQKTYQVNKDVLCEMVPDFECFKSGNANGSTLHCYDLEPSLFESVIGHYTTRFPVIEKNKKSDETLNEALGYFNTWGAAQGRKRRDIDDDGNDNRPSNDDASNSSTNKLYSSGDATFIVGADKTEIKANRAVLAAMSPVLKRMPYGVGTITADETKPIVWPDFDGESVSLDMLFGKGRHGFLCRKTKLLWHYLFWTILESLTTSMCSVQILSLRIGRISFLNLMILWNMGKKHV